MKEPTSKQATEAKEKRVKAAKKEEFATRLRQHSPEQQQNMLKEAQAAERDAKAAEGVASAAAWPRERPDKTVKRGQEGAHERQHTLLQASSHLP